MLFIPLSTAFLATLVSAHAPQGFHHKRQVNGTAGFIGSTGLARPQTTLTVFATNVYTITSCAASITDCPSRPMEATHEVVVTDTIALTTTVCPVTEVASASSVILSSFTSSAPVTSSTGVPFISISPGAGVGAGAGAGTPESVEPTYTLGTGKSTTIVATTNVQTAIATAVATVPDGGDGASGAFSDDITITSTSISTSTKYITVVPIITGASKEIIASGGFKSTTNSNANSACVPVTVTVAAPTLTITETIFPTAVETTGGVKAIVGPEDYVTTWRSATDVVTISTITVIPLSTATSPYSYSNTTNSASFKCSSCSGVIASGAAPTNY